MANALIALTYAMASAALAAVLQASGMADWFSAAAAGLLLFLAAAELHTRYITARDKRSTAREIANLKRANREFAKALEETGHKMQAMNAAIEARANAQSRKIVAELQVLESLMKDFAGKIAAKAKSEPAGEDLIERRAGETTRSYLEGLGESELLETIRASLEESRVDLYLQPIVSLPQRKLRFYEALSRLRAEDGSVIMPAQYIKVAAPAGLMSMVDNLLLFRCVQIVRRLIQKSRDIGVFCNISDDTLANAEFFPQFLEYMHHNRDLTAQIVFEFGQESVTNASPKMQENLLHLSSLGFALSMDHVETLAMDFGKLKSLGFRHLKVRGGMLASANAAGFRNHGLNLIAEHVEDEEIAARLSDYGIDFGQGYLFGEPRAVRDDSLKSLDRAEPSAPVIPFKRVG